MGLVSHTTVLNIKITRWTDPKLSYLFIILLFSVLMRLAITHLICDCQNFRQVENELSLIHTLTCLSIKQMTVLNWHLDRNVVSDFGAEVLIGFHTNQRAVDAD